MIVYNIAAVLYIGIVIYLITEPWHYEISEVADEVKRSIYRTWSDGRFYFEAKIDLFLLT